MFQNGADETDAPGSNLTDWYRKEITKNFFCDPDKTPTNCDPENNTCGCGDQITDNDIFDYMYGVMHAPDWRERYASDLQREHPRIPFVRKDRFHTFRVAGRELGNLHVGYETCPEAEGIIEEYDGNPEGSQLMEDTHDHDPDLYYRIDRKMRLEEDKKKDGTYRLVLNSRFALTNIPASALEYEISGRNILKWQCDALRSKETKGGGAVLFVDDVNEHDDWVTDRYNLVRHLKRLIHVGQRSSEIINSLPPSLETD